MQRQIKDYLYFQFVFLIIQLLKMCTEYNRQADIGGSLIHLEIGIVRTESRLSAEIFF